MSVERIKRRNLMEYYSNPDISNQTEPNPVEQKRADPFSLDDPAFSTELYLEKYLNEGI
jgi:hypothetical protein